MNTSRLERISGVEWRLPASGPMRAPGVLFADEALLRDMDDQVLVQLAGMASLPGIRQAAYALPDAHSGYGFPIGGVAAFDPADGVISAGGVGFDIACGVRTLHTGLTLNELAPRLEALADGLFRAIPAGVGSTGGVRMKGGDIDAMLRGGARWAVERGYGVFEDLARTEDGGVMEDADPRQVSDQAKQRQQEEMGTLGSGNHYLEIQHVMEVFDPESARSFGLKTGDILLSLHCGSRGLGHQVAADYAARMLAAAAAHGLRLADRELACAPIASAEGRAYWGAMNAATNCALANRQILTHLARQVFQSVAGAGAMPLFQDVCHNTCKREIHAVDGERLALYVHRKGATRACAGQPVLVGGSMGTASHILAGLGGRAFGSASHGAGRRMSRGEAIRRWNGHDVVRHLAHRGILIKSRSPRGVAEEAPQAYKDVDAVAAVVETAGLARRVCRLEPLACVKG